MLKVNFEFEEDFPCSVDPEIDPRKLYEAFLKADALINGAPKSIREIGESRLAEITSFLYRGGDAAAALFRKNDDASEKTVGIWLSSVRRISGWLAVVNEVPKFSGLEKELLFELPRRFRSAETLREIPSYLSQFGVILVWEKSLPSMKLDGAIFQSSSNHVVVALSLRYARLDNFWFTLLHELAHAVLHADQLESPILDNLDIKSESLIEKQADRLASDSLIPRSEWRSCPARYSNSIADIVSFADRLGIPPQCVAGRLQREQGRYDLFSGITNEIDVRSMLNAN